MLDVLADFLAASEAFCVRHQLDMTLLGPSISSASSIFHSADVHFAQTARFLNPSRVLQQILSQMRLSAACPWSDPKHRDSLLTLASTPWTLEDAMQYDFVSELGASSADWELVQAELLDRARASTVVEELPWAEGLWCFNPHCTNLSGLSELSLKTYECGGGCGARYCSSECMERCWREGHRQSCEALARRVSGRDRAAVAPGGGAF